MDLLATELEGYGRMGFRLSIGLVPPPAADEGGCAPDACKGVTEPLHVYCSPVSVTIPSVRDAHHPPFAILRVAGQGRHGPAVRSPVDDDTGHTEFC